MEALVTIVVGLICAAASTRLWKVEMHYPAKKLRRLFAIMFFVGVIGFQFSINFYVDCIPNQGCIHWGDPLLKGIKK